MKIYLVDDNKEFRENLKLFLEGHLNHSVVAEASEGESFMANLHTDADIILMDINMPGISGLEATKMGTWNNSTLKIIAVSQYREMIDLEILIGRGFKGFVSKTNLFRDLEPALEAVYNGNYFFPDEIKSIPFK